MITVALICTETNSRTVRVAFLGQNAFRDANALLNILVTHPELDVGQRKYLITSVDLGHEPWSTVSTWADMTRRSVARFIHFRLVTPMTMRGPSTDTGSTPYFPRPLPLFSELLRRWQQLAGPPLHDEVTPYLQRRGCVVADYRLLTQDVMLAHGKQEGLLGWIIYECREQHALCIGALNMLARLASSLVLVSIPSRGWGLYSWWKEGSPWEYGT